MAVDLLGHNLEAYEKIREALASGIKKLAISHATGTGKSYLIGKLFEDYNDKKKLVLVPSAYIKEQMQKIFNKYNIVNVDVMLYQKLIKLEDKDISDMDYDVIALDEFHHDTSKVWGSKVKILIESHADSIIFGTTATPVRSDGINALDELFEGNCVSELPLSTAIAKKVVPLPVYVSALYSLDEELECLREKVKNATNTEEEKKELYNKIDSMRKQIDKSYGMPIILNKHIRDKEGKYLVFCKNKKHLAEIKDTVIEWFKIAGFKDIHAYVVHSSYEGKDKEYKAFCGDKSHNLKLLFCVNMLNEGLHLSDISGVLLLRPTNSNIVWHQQIGRCIESNNSKNPVIIDAVNNFNSVQQGIGLLQEIKEAVAKEKESGNRGSGDSDLIDINTFFVTEYVQNVQEMFEQIEGRLKDSWDLYIRALEQYKEREGDCLVPDKHVENIENIEVNLGQWVRCIRLRRKGKNNYLLTNKMIKKLEAMGFVWEVYQYRCKIYLQALRQYRNREGNCLVPVRHIEIMSDGEKINLGQWVNRIRVTHNGGRTYKSLTQEDIDELNDLNFMWKIKKENSFEKFYRYICDFKRDYGHINIKYSDTIHEYNIGKMYSHFFNEFKKGKLSDEQNEKLREIGIDFSIDKEANRHKNNLELSKRAVEEGVIICVKNQIYHGVNLYNWAKKYKNRFSADEQLTIEKLLSKDVRKPTSIQDKSGKVYMYSSMREAGCALCNFFHVVDNENKGITIVYNRISGYVKSPIYKGLLIEKANA